MLFVAGCEGGQFDEVCMPDGNTDAAADGTEVGKGEEVDKALMDGHIISKIVGKIKEKVIGDGVTGGAAQNMFMQISMSPSYQGAVSAMFSLFIIFYGLGVATGIIQTTVGDAVIRAAKVGFIAVTASNWFLFYDIIGSFFIDGTDELIKYFLDSFKDIYSPESNQTQPGSEDFIFGDLDRFVAMVFSTHMFAIISALFSPTGSTGSPYGTVYALVLVFSIMYILSGILKVVTIYSFSLFAKAILFALAPIFLAFLLFSQTKNLFDGWFKQLVNYSLQPVMVSAFLGLFIALIEPFLSEFLGMPICNMKSDDNTHAQNWRFVDNTQDPSPLTFGASTPPPLSIQASFLLFFFAWLFGTYIKLAEQLSSGITVTLAGNLSDAAAWFKSSQAGGAGGGLPNMPGGKGNGGLF